MKMSPDIYNITRTDVQDIVGAINNVKQPLQELLSIKNQSQLKKTLEEIRKTTGLNEILCDTLSIKKGDKTIIFSSKDLYSFSISEKNAKTNTIDKNLVITGRSIEEAKGFENDTQAISNFLSKICEVFDLPLLKLRQMLKSNSFINFFETFSKRPTLSTENIAVVEEIKNIFQKIYKNLESVENVPTRSHIKNGYTNVKKGTHGTRRLEFEKIGNNKENFSLNILVDRTGKQNVVIRVTDESNATKNIIVEPDGKVLKFKNIGRKCDLSEGMPPQYYSQKELDSIDITEHLTTLKDELENYNNYIIKRIEQYNIFNAKSRTTSIGIIDDRAKKFIKEIQSKYDVLKAAMYKLKSAELKNKAKKKLSIYSKAGSPCFIFKELTPYNEDILISFPIIKGKSSTKILILGHNNKIKKSLFVQDDKLVKFNATSIGRSKRTEHNFNYHSQAEIEESGLNKYLKIINQRLDEIIEKISKGKGWYN